MSISLAAEFNPESSCRSIGDSGKLRLARSRAADGDCPHRTEICLQTRHSGRGRDAVRDLALPGKLSIGAP